jgi:hypothetical protein
VRSAIQQYGLQNARNHAMANYNNLTLADLRNIEQTAALVNLIVVSGPNGKAATRPGDHGVCRQACRHHCSGSIPFAVPHFSRAGASPTFSNVRVGY